jgi:hypothetical protein
MTLTGERFRDLVGEQPDPFLAPTAHGEPFFHIASVFAQ